MEKLLLAAVLFTALVTSCKKETVVTYSSNTLVTGTWAGKFTAGSIINADWVAILNADGSCRVYDSKITDTATNIAKLDGLYNISNGALKVYTRTMGSIQCKFDGIVNGNTISGTIVWSVGNASGGNNVTAGNGNLTKL